MVPSAVQTACGMFVVFHWRDDQRQVRSDEDAVDTPIWCWMMHVRSDMPNRAGYTRIIRSLRGGAS